MPQPHENLTPMAHASQNRCFGCGEANPVGLHLKFFLAEDSSVVCDVTMPDTYEGPVGFVHGGIIATLLDETMSKSVRARGVTAMTRQMEVEYLKPVPSGSAIRIEGHVTHHEGRKHWVHARVVNHEGVELARSKALFIQIYPIK